MNFELDISEISENIQNAECVTCVTLVGYPGIPPLKRGNCFAVRTKEGARYHIVNFCHENWAAMLERNLITLPIKVLPLNENIAVVCDERIPDNWYSKKFCEVCCPEIFLPLDQRLRIWRWKATGALKERIVGEHVLRRVDQAICPKWEGDHV
jgi:hypothetical protein